ncbi:hypothetical protein GOV12_07290 [Candidatus Pacearchaeota archaeon]|nr:hypothetical protein [Candidatus Pacearchaeota archaeon]
MDAYEESYQRLKDGLGEFRDKVCGFGLSVKQEEKLYRGLRDGNPLIIVNSSRLRDEQISDLEESAKNLYQMKVRATSLARDLPATNDCDEHALRKVDEVWNRILGLTID